ncbi:MAG: hypothetical protein WC408_02045 [Candidatus Micrarchaeia archaeon]
MSSKISPRKHKEDEEEDPLDDVGSFATEGAAVDDSVAKESVGARLKSPSGAILVPGAEIIREAQRKKDEIIAAANAKADDIIAGAKKDASRASEKTIAAAREKAGKDKDKILEQAHKDAKKVRLAPAAEISKAGQQVFSKVYGDLF